MSFCHGYFNLKPIQDSYCQGLEPSGYPTSWSAMTRTVTRRFHHEACKLQDSAPYAPCFANRLIHSTQISTVVTLRTKT
jgi:hypothetical protein